MITIVSTEKAPAAIGPYSQAIVTRDLVFTSGQIPIDPATGEVVKGGIAEQSHQVMKKYYGGVGGGELLRGKGHQDDLLPAGYE